MWSAVKNLFAASGDDAYVREPLCFVIGDDEARRSAIAVTVRGLGLQVEEFPAVAPISKAATQNPNLVFFDLERGCAAAEEAIGTLAVNAKGVVVQLVSPVEVATYEQVCAIGHARLFGESRGVKMLPALGPPFRPEAIAKVVQDLGLQAGAFPSRRVTLAQALRNDWLELWYQPKIDLASKRLVGAEGLIRAQHPQYGTIYPDRFLPGAGENDMLALTERVIVAALRDWETLAAQGVTIKLAVNAPVSALTKLPIATILCEERPKAENWPGLILEVTESEIVNDLQVASEVAAGLRAQHCSLAIDDFGAGYSSLARLKQLPFSELKIDRSYVTDCHTDRTNAGLCEVIIDLAHRFGLTSVAEGIETTHESHKLQSLGCKAGQGYLFAKPMPFDRFVAVLRRRLIATAAA